MDLAKGPRPRSLVARVALTTALAAAGTALVAASAAAVIADRLVVAAEDRRLRATANGLLTELEAIPDTAAKKIEVSDEARELALGSVRVAAWEGAGRLGGDPSLPRLEVGTCGRETRAAVALRACAVGRAGLVVVASSAQVAVDPGIVALGCLVAAFLAAALAAVVSRRAAQWALRPLTSLEREVARVRPDDPSAASVQPSVQGDVLEIASLRRTLAALLARLVSEVDRARRFSAEAAHELRTPLTALSTELELLAEEPLDAQSREAVERLQKRAVSLSRLVEGLLALSTTAEGARMVGPFAVAIEDVVETVVARLKPGPRARLKLTVEASGIVRGDEALLVALVENAIDNALKFAKEGLVEVTVREHADQVILDVVDQGPGIPKESRELVFEPFFRTPEARAQAPGHGVGLSLVAHIARVHGGEAGLVDAPLGAHLRVRFPIWASLD